jgi:hypothetical protein
MERSKEEVPVGRVLDWGTGWAPINEDGSAQELELAKELGEGHPLQGVQRILFGRCLRCDDVVAALACVPGEPELAVIHLTWRGAPEVGPKWPYFERLTTAEFLVRFVEGGEHLG